MYKNREEALKTIIWSYVNKIISAVFKLGQEIEDLISTAAKPLFA